MDFGNKNIIIVVFLCRLFHVNNCVAIAKNPKLLTGIMAKEDVMLEIELGRLYIEPHKPPKAKNNENPFSPSLQKRYLRKQKISKCSCMIDKSKNVGISKNKPNKIIKEPVLQLLRKSCTLNTGLDIKECGNKYENNVTNTLNGNIDSLNLCTLVQNCNQLKISSEVKDPNKPTGLAADESRWWKAEVLHVQESRESGQNSRSGMSSCSQQALNPPCDVTIDELASYFETLVHIPKKMSSMAEMMYI